MGPVVPRCVMLALIALTGGSVGCKKAPKKEASLSSREHLERIRDTEWRRHDNDGLLPAYLKHKDPFIRARAAQALGRISASSTARLEALTTVVDDPADHVRAEAYAGLALTLLDASDETWSQAQRGQVLELLRRQVEREKSELGLQALFWALGWLGQPADLGLLTAVFHQQSGPEVRPPRPGKVRDAAITAWGMIAGRVAAPKADLRPLFALLEAKAPRSRRLAAWALARAGQRSWSDSQRQRLKEVGRKDADEGVRAWLTRAFGAQGDGTRSTQDWFLGQLADPSSRVRLEAAKALGNATVWSAVKLTTALRRLWRAVGMSHYRLTGEQLLPMLGGIQALDRHARVATIHQFAADMLELSDASDSSVRYGATEALSIDLVHCAAARLWDLGKGRIERSATCGTARAPQLGSDWRRVHVVGVIRDIDREEHWKLTMLRRYLKDPSPSVRSSAVRALATVRGQQRVVVLANALTDPDLGVFHAAAQGLASLRSDPTAELQGKLVRRLSKLNVLEQPEPVCAVAQALASLGARAELPRIGRLAGRPSRLVQRCARRALRQLAASPSRSPVASRGLPLLRWAGKGSGRSLPRQAIVVTRKGEVVIELLSDAPAAVAHFARLAVHGKFKQTRIIRDGDLDLVRAGMARLDGQPTDMARVPCELNQRPFEIGSVGLVSSGRDTGARAFFITLTRRPSLDGRRTQFGRVVAGLDVVRRMQNGERIKDLYIPKEPRILPRPKGN